MHFPTVFQKIIDVLIFSSQLNESGLKIFSIEDLQNAAEKSVQFSKVVKMAREIDVGVEFTLGI
jgi:hypothetical protein